METTQTHTLNFTGVLSQSKKIITTKYFHFVTLSLFFLPLSFTLITTPTLHRHRHFSDHLFFSDQNQPFLYYLIYSLIIHLISLCAIATITYSTHHTFLNQPITFFTSLKSLTFLFFPLVSTAIVAHVLMAFMCITFFTFVGTLLMLIQTLGFPIDHTSIYFISFSVITGSILLAILIYFHIDWSLAFVVVVVESKWGFAPLMRSSYLINGMRSVSLFIMLYFGVIGTIMVWICSKNLYDQHSWISLIVMILGLFIMMMFLLRITAANTVLYNYCKALHGELAIEVEDGFVHDYLNLDCDDEKMIIPHVVAVAA